MPKELDVLITFDTTGSMYPCLTQVRRRVEDVVRRLVSDHPRIRIAIMAHGDYCDARTSYVTKFINFTSDIAAICHFIRNVEGTNGGDTPECYELVLNQARSLSWQAGSEKVLIMIGDDVPHEASYPANVAKINWRNELDLLLEAGIHVYGIHAMPGIRQHSKRFYQEIASKTNGYYLTMDQFAALPDIIMAISCQQAGVDQLRAFQQEVQQRHSMTRNMASVFETLSGVRVEVAERPGLQPVPSGRFQIMEVETGMAIRDFVLSQGANFKKGRGFYQFTKTETIQEKKEVVLRDKTTGDMYTGAEAREMIGLPFGMRGKIKPAKLAEFDVFVQSTSYNRKLIGDTLFLYEVEDWDR